MQFTLSAILLSIAFFSAGTNALPVFPGQASDTLSLGECGARLFSSGGFDFVINLFS